jgi:rRNA processing protein Krr1/Pno1
MSYVGGGDRRTDTWRGSKNSGLTTMGDVQEKLPHRESRTVPIPPHRFTPLRQSWPKLYTPLVEHLKLQVRVNVKRKAVDLRTGKATTDPGALQKG